MRSKLFRDKVETVKTETGRWVRIWENPENAYNLYDLLAGMQLGRILFDQNENWIYDSDALSIAEQEDIAGKLTGNQGEMEQFLKSIKG